MTWLDEHIKNEVLPLLKPGVRNIRPAKADCEALGLLISAVRSFGLDRIPAYDEKKDPGWCDLCKSVHLESWNYKGKRKGTPEPLALPPAKIQKQIEFSKEEWEVIKNSVRSMKAKAGGARIILPGRDAFLWHMMLEKIGYPHIYDPRISRSVAHAEPVYENKNGWNYDRVLVSQKFQPAFVDILKSWEIKPDDYIVDTGFMGTIPKAINAASGMQLRWSMLSADGSVIGCSGGGSDWYGKPLPMKFNAEYKTEFDKQIFPRHKGSRNLALKIEALPKYQESARIVNGKVVQDAAQVYELMKAALFTISAWYSY